MSFNNTLNTFFKLNYQISRNSEWQKLHEILAYLLHDEKNSSGFDVLYWDITSHCGMCRCIYVHFSQRVVSSLSAEVDNNLQIYSRQICSRWRRRARASWKARHRAASYFINYNEGYTAPSLNIHETQPHLVYSPGTERTFSRRRSV